MKEIKLVSMTDYVLNLDSKTSSSNEFRMFAINYTEFLQTPLDLGMFIPCDKDGIPIDKPDKCYDDKQKCKVLCDKMCTESDYAKIYQEAEENVLFKGVSVLFTDISSIGIAIENYDFIINYSKLTGVLRNLQNGKLTTIEDLISFDLTLTESAIKKFKI